MSYQPAIMSASLGRAWIHDFHYKMEQAAKAGFKGMEIFYEDLEYLARKKTGSDDYSNEHILEAAREAYAVCKKHNLEIIGLQPFLFYEGLKDREQHAKLIEKMKLWLLLADELHTDTIQIPGNFLPAEQLTDDLDVHAADLRQLADMGAAHNPLVRYAYENLCWSTFNDTWEKAWDMVQRVDRPNFGLCLDTFNIAGRVWADPASPTGKTPNADADLSASLERMVREIDLSKVFYIQVVDAERLSAPLVAGHPYHVEGNPARMMWSRNARTFMYEEDRGAYLPVEEVAKTIIHKLGYKGFVSMELFSRTMAEEGQHVPDEHARRGMAAWGKLCKRLELHQ
ncbi:3-dehydroshikimate dehydratase [Pestalotiopsis fici W106-1]|uniref:3-dehydroshikimate dehydratase n=1 Tax=Pestalotiopsis fici (strain W106-1 / CGMCC3.15140) TaxID=1229662 RepID=W3WHD0_PESFW|nr:3-dehydroshikimate dehydratase [Pestalotiopsis fici W106-1]ETS73320.1 3-dehydroshikimate dehydratase [Pestalotiopsis fici W106-1]